MAMDVQKIRGKMAEKGFNITTLSNELGISRNTLSVYFEAPEKMPYCIVQKIADILCDDQREAMLIFFATNFRSTKESARKKKEKRRPYERTKSI